MKFLLLLGSVILLMLGHAIKIQRWSRFIRIYERPPLGALLRSMSLGYALNYVLPFKLGDLVRAIYSGRRMKNGVGLSLATVILDRFLDVLGYLISDLLRAKSGAPLRIPDTTGRVHLENFPRVNVDALEMALKDVQETMSRIATRRSTETMCLQALAIKLFEGYK